MRVLVVKTSSMGDVVHALPMVSDIARAFPHARVDWVIEDSFADLPRLHPAVTRVIPVALRRWRRQPLALDSWRELLAARTLIRQTRYHTIIDCQGLIKSALISCVARGPVVGFSARSAREASSALFCRRRVVIDWFMHAVDRNRRLGAAALGYAPDLPEDFGVRARARALHAEPPFDQPGAVLLLTNASRPGKLWPDEHWVAVEQSLARAGRPCWLAWGSRAEEASSRGRVERMQAARMLPRSSLVQIAALASRAALVVGLDTGLTHLAAAVGAPTVGIYCDYDPAQAGLRGSAPVRSLGGIGQVPGVAQVLEAIEGVLSAVPDGARRAAP